MKELMVKTKSAAAMLPRVSDSKSSELTPGAMAEAGQFLGERCVERCVAEGVDLLFASGGFNQVSGLLGLRSSSQCPFDGG